MDIVKLPIVRYGKAGYCKLRSVFPDDFLEIESHDSITVHTGALSFQFISPNMSEEEIVETLASLVGKEVVLKLRFFSLKVRKGMINYDLIEGLPEGKLSVERVESRITLPLKPTKFGEVNCKVRGYDEGIGIILPSGELFIPNEISFTTENSLFSYGIGGIELKELRDGKESFTSYDLLAIY